jgi:hypothetical protein
MYDREYQAEDRLMYERICKPLEQTEQLAPRHIDLQIYTSRVGCRLDGAVDITASTGHLLAPTWPLVRAYKHGQIDAVEYRKRYIALLQARWREHKESFKLLMNESSIVLCCYCPAGQFCHRLIAAEVLVKVAKYFGVNAEYRGER